MNVSELARVCGLSIVMDKTFAKFAANTMSPEYAHLQQVRQDYPLYTVVQRHIRKNTKQEHYIESIGLKREYRLRMSASVTSRYACSVTVTLECPSILLSV